MPCLLQYNHPMCLSKLQHHRVRILQELPGPCFFCKIQHPELPGMSNLSSCRLRLLQSLLRKRNDLQLKLLHYMVQQIDFPIHPVRSILIPMPALQRIHRVHLHRLQKKIQNISQYHHSATSSSAASSLQPTKENTAIIDITSSHKNTFFTVQPPFKVFGIESNGFEKFIASFTSLPYEKGFVPFYMTIPKCGFSIS